MAEHKRLRVLVTGVDGDSGQGLVKALRMSSSPMEIHGCDLSGGGVGGTFVDTLHLVPPASAGDPYVERLDRICGQYGVDAVVPSTPVEIDALCGRGNPPALPSGVPIVCLPDPYRKVFDDKLFCYQSLEGFVPLAPYADGSDPAAVQKIVERQGFPLIVKRRRGRGGDSFHVVRKEAELAPALEKTADPVVQGFIDDGGGEFTVGVFAADERVTALAFRRRLGRTGSSWFAQTVDDLEITAYAEAIAKASGLRGSANVQLRKSSTGVRLLEVNARFSSLAPARAYAGFRDVEWSVVLALGGEPDVPRNGYRPIKFQRFVHEMVDDGEGYAPVPQWTRWARARLLGDSPDRRTAA
ncbi:MAG TPA: ATP-grasp domain-containing protein [Planctomycetota bacterium]|nr:ATP-grasp domain-containing protein [Planctomycetota bacterium]